MGFQLNSQNLKNISEKYNRNYLLYMSFRKTYIIMNFMIRIEN